MVFLSSKTYDRPRSREASGGGIWGPGGASIDPATNNVFVATGNADTSKGAQQNAGYAEQVVELSPTLGTVIANNYPTNIPIIDGDDDFDFGATPLLFTPYGCPLLMAAINKSGMFELHDLSSISNGPMQVQRRPSVGSEWAPRAKRAAGWVSQRCWFEY